MNTTTKIVPKIKFKDEINKSDHFRHLKLINKKIKVKKILLKSQSQNQN